MALETGIEPNQDHPQPQRQPQPQSQQRSAAGRAAAQQPEAETPLEVVETTGDALFDNVHQTMERFAATRIGQFVIERGDRLLRTIEETAKWSVPNAKSDSTPLRRPLSWIPFLALIITLRQVRFWLSLGALLIGNGPVTAQELVYFLQTRRRKLRCIRIHGLKVMRHRKLVRTVQQSANSSNTQDAGFMVKVGKLLTVAMCRPGYLSEPARRVHVVQSDEAREQRPLPPRLTQKRQREDDTPEADLTCTQMLAKYANENSEDDSDYTPNREEDESTSGSSTSNDSQSEYKSATNNDENTDNNTPKKDINAEAETNSPNNGIAEQSSTEADMNVAPKNALEPMPKPAEIENKENTESTVASPPPLPQSQTSLENGPSNGGENREADVVQIKLQKQTRILKSSFNSTKNIPNGHAPLEKSAKLSENESDSAAAAHVVRTRSPPLLPHNNHILNAIIVHDNDERNIATTTDGYNDDINDADATAAANNDDNYNSDVEKLNIAVAHTPSYNPPTHANIKSNASTNITTNANTNSQFNTRPFPSYSTASSSSSSLASSVTSDDFVADSESYRDAPTPTPSLDSYYLDCANALNAASSSEDVFYSPIGSPPNFNAFLKSTIQPINKPISQTISKSIRFNSIDDHSTPKTLQATPQPEDEIPSTSQKAKQLRVQRASTAPAENANYESKSQHSRQRNRRYRR